MDNNHTPRRKAFKKIGLSLAALFGVGVASAKPADSKPKPEKRVVGEVIADEQGPLFSSAIAYGNLLFFFF